MDPYFHVNFCILKCLLVCPERRKGKNIAVYGRLECTYTMATLKQRLHRKNASGTYDTIHLETSADMVLMASGIDLQTTMTGRLLAANTNLNTITDPGVYYCPANATVKTMTNCPTANAFTMEVYKHAGTHQRLVEYLASGTPKIYWRNLYNGTWLAWQREYTTLDAQTSVTGNAGTATKLATGRTIRTNLESTSTATFDGSANVTPGVTGTLPVANGGTGVTSLNALKKALGMAESQGAGTSFDIANAGIGNFVKWANKMWIIVHAESDRIYLAATFFVTDNIYFGSNNAYNGSTLAASAKTYENTIPADSLALAVNTTVNGVTAKIFAPSYEQMNGGFAYFYSDTQRELSNTGYWTSSQHGSNIVWLVTPAGKLVDGNATGNPRNMAMFRPFVALKR